MALTYDRSGGTQPTLDIVGMTMCNKRPCCNSCSEAVPCTARDVDTSYHLPLVQVHASECENHSPDGYCVLCRRDLSHLHCCILAAAGPPHDVFCQFWLVHLHIQHLMVLSLIRRLHTKFTEAELHLPAASQCALCAARTSRCTLQLKQCRPRQSHL